MNQLIILEANRHDVETLKACNRKLNEIFGIFPLGYRTCAELKNGKCRIYFAVRDEYTLPAALTCQVAKHFKGVYCLVYDFATHNVWTLQKGGGLRCEFDKTLIEDDRRHAICDCLNFPNLYDFLHSVR